MTPHQRDLIIATLRLRAVLEANRHYGGDLDRGIAKELSDLADELDAPDDSVPDTPLGRALAQEPQRSIVNDALKATATLPTLESVGFPPDECAGIRAHKLSREDSTLPDKSESEDWLNE
jgi:hypothetical protein